MAEAFAVQMATATKFFKGASDLTPRKRLWLAMLYRYGNFVKNANSYQLTTTIEYSQPPIRQFGDAGDLSFNFHDPLKQFTIDYRGYFGTDKLTLKQNLMNEGPTQIDNMFENKSKRILKSLDKTIGAALYVNGDAAGNENAFQGINTIFGTKYTACAAGDRIATPNGTYGGLSMNLSSTGATWSSNLAAADRPNATLANDWPYGSGSVEYDFFSPHMWNTNSTGWPSAVAGWGDNCEEIMAAAKITSANLSGDEGVPMIHMLDAKMFGDFQRLQRSRLRILVPHKESNDLGFSDVLDFEGAAVKFEFDCPAGTGFGIVPDAMELLCMGKQLFTPYPPEWKLEMLAWLYAAGGFGNLRWQPKFFNKYADFTV